jgi:AraC-like DNA-binding protein
MSAPTIEEPIAERRPLPRGDVRALPARRLRRVTEYIRQNLDKGLSLGELAAVVCMSPYHFARLFKYSTGVPPHRFVVRQRIAQARAWLARPELSIAQISRLVGFRTPESLHHGVPAPVRRNAAKISTGSMWRRRLGSDGE